MDIQKDHVRTQLELIPEQIVSHSSLLMATETHQWRSVFPTDENRESRFVISRGFAVRAFIASNRSRIIHA